MKVKAKDDSDAASDHGYVTELNYLKGLTNGMITSYLTTVGVA